MRAAREQVTPREHGDRGRHEINAMGAFYAPLMARYFDVHPLNPQRRVIGQVVGLVRDGGLIAYPTDSCFALGCQLGNSEGLQRKEDRTADVVAQALRTGFRGLDTANQRRHYHEAEVGRAMLAELERGTLRREDVFVQTKFTFRTGQDFEPTPAEMNAIEHAGA